MHSVSGVTYSKRAVPPPSDDLRKWAAKFAGWLGYELGNIQAGIAKATSRTVTTNWTATNGDGLILIDTTSGNVTVTLPDPEAVRDMVLTVKRITAGGNTATIVGTVDGAVDPTLAGQWDSLTVWAHVPTAGSGSWFTIAVV